MKGVYAKANADQMAVRYSLLCQLQRDTADRKMEISRQVIATALARGPAAILYSGGRDSTVLLDIVKSMTEDFLVLFNNTTLGDPRNVTFIRHRCRDLNYIETTADDPIETWQRTGYWPILSKRGFTKYKHRDPGLRVSPVQCCYQLKEKYANKILNNNKIKVVFWGNRASESMRRRLTFLDNGFLFQPKKYKWMQAYPLQHWMDEDIDQYLSNRVPGYLQARQTFETGCLCCGTDITFWPNNLSRLYQQDRLAWTKYMSAGFAEQIMRIKGIKGNPADIIESNPTLLLKV